MNEQRGRILLDEQDRIATLVVNRAEMMNSFDDAMIEEFTRAVDQANGGDARVLIVTGSGDRSFCAGYDVRCIDPDQAENTPLPDTRFEPAVRSLEKSRTPVVGALNGNAFGGGLDLALACDYLIASSDARLAMTPCRLGLVYSHTGVARFVARLGGKVTRRLFLTAAPIDADEAHRLGVLDEISHPSQLMDRAKQVARTMTQNAPIAMAGSRATILAVEEAVKIDEKVTNELREHRMKALRSSDLRESLSAFRDKRPAILCGK